MKDFKLDNETKIKTGFKVPEGFFDSFSEKVLSKIETELPNEKPKIISIFERNKKWALSIAATLLVFITVGYYFFNLNKTKNENLELEHYIVNQTDITDDDFVSLLNENDIEKIAVEYHLDQNTTDNLDLDNLNLEENL